MPEEEIIEAQNEPEAETVESSPDSESESTDQELQPDQTNEEAEEPLQPEVEPKKQTRGEKRIKKLLEKNKSLESEIERISSEMGMPRRLPWEKDEPLIKPEELESGIDPRELERRIEQKTERKVAEYVNNIKRTEDFKRQVSDHASDLEKVLETYPELNDETDKFDPDLLEEFLDSYNDANYLPDGTFYPRKKGSDIANRMFKRVTKSVARQTSEITGKLVKQASEGAVAPNTSSTRTPNYEEEGLLSQALDSGRTEDWAEVLKRRFKK